MLFVLLRFLIANINALLTAIQVYWLGLRYALWEFLVDLHEKQKLVPENVLFKQKSKAWKKQSPILQMLERKIVETDDEGEQLVSAYRLTAVLTGGEGTIGIQILDYLLSLGFYVVVIGLNPPAIVSNENVEYVHCDLSARNEVFEAIESVQLKCEHIDLLILNAAMMLSPNSFGWFPFQRLDFLGQKIIEPHLAVNALANAQLFASFSQRLENSKCSMPRAVFLSSCTARAGDISLLLQDEEAFWCRHLNGYKSYSDSKLLLSIYVRHLSKVLKYRHSKITVCSVHPGVVPGKLYRNVFWPFRWIINNILGPFLRSPSLAAAYVLDAAFSDQNEDGAYYENGFSTELEGFDDPDRVWMIGKSVREMIVDCSDTSFALFEDNNSTIND